jgi:cell division septation protein DedD
MVPTATGNYISDEIRKLAYNFWIDPNNSRPYGNKNDMKRVRIGPKQFSKHIIFRNTWNSIFFSKFH